MSHVTAPHINNSPARSCSPLTPPSPCRHTRCVRRQLLRMLKFLHRKRTEFVRFMNSGDGC